MNNFYLLGVSESSPPPDGYLPMKPGYTFQNYYTLMEGHNSKQGNLNFIFNF
jgi:hypothetical protein